MKLQTKIDKSCQWDRYSASIINIYTYIYIFYWWITGIAT